MTYTDPFTEEQLFDFDAPAVSLADKFGVPPMSVLDRRGGEWKDRKRRWMSLGLESELGRDAAAVHIASGREDPFAKLLQSGGAHALIADGVSIFDPVICELTYRWFTKKGDRILDPFAGGSVRGIVASTLARWYDGIDLRPEQVEANQAQTHLGSDITPQWHVGDSRDMEAAIGAATDYDLIFTCPPYGDLEKYSDDPADISTMTHPEFLDAQADIIKQSVARLRNDRFVIWVTSDIRDKKGAYRGLVADTIKAFEAADLTFHNEAIMLDPVGAAAVRAERPFRATRKLARVHQHLLVFCKGDAKRAAQRLEGGTT